MTTYFVFGFLNRDVVLCVVEGVNEMVILLLGVFYECV